MRAADIVALAKGLRDSWNTNDPFEIAKKFGIEVLFRDVAIKGFTAQTIKIPGYPTIISINDAFNEKSKKILCAHELGHALLHDESVNHFSVTKRNVMTYVERDANLFAVALLIDDETEAQLSGPLVNMENHLLKAILDYNIVYPN
jgi:Zn-dependent peptidase ImmA (M78 family)